MGTAEPPHRIARSEDRSRPSSSGSRPIQIVGTPAVIVTRSSSSIAAIAAGVICGPGSISSAPANSGACPQPQAFAWNIGTTGSSRSRSITPIPADALSTPSECR